MLPEARVSCADVSIHYSLSVVSEMLARVEQKWIVIVICRSGIRQSVDSLCRDGVDTLMLSYIRKAFTRTNVEDLSLCRYLIMVYE